MKNPISVGNSYTPTTHFIVLCLSLFTILLSISTFPGGGGHNSTGATGLQSARPGFFAFDASIHSHCSTPCVCYSKQHVLHQKPPIIGYRQGLCHLLYNQCFLHSCLHFFKLFSKEEEDTVALPLCFPQNGFRNHKFLRLPLFS